MHPCRLLWKLLPSSAFSIAQLTAGMPTVERACWDVAECSFVHFICLLVRVIGSLASPTEVRWSSTGDLAEVLTTLTDERVKGIAATLDTW
mgnify:CR=1 FL=1